ncbi:hypothetical protein [Mycolicibacterium fluoranthenivorans]|uniref:Uncharacterized protein n=1 Tax=Mycolicibacterium fluoranthenivorans TaxID=258505 RepID=A0A7X5U1P5_9MYCO|nr:hypothetical protein [Mycolicibacterium fluoranthenivorans]MCV7359708.1 hypothetical protein [Mycolicibacterium fluoranthenivorans]NIH96754.1 hypothetical protein [Mycolicibacterium fluoranthenivorans]
MKLLLLGLAVVCGSVVGAPRAVGDTPHGNFELRIHGRYDFHTWIWALSGCDGDCLHVQAIPQPNAKAFPYSGDAHLVDGRYTLVVDVPDGLRCGNVYYGPVVPTRDVYSWDAVTRSGTLSSSFAAGCDGAPGATLTYPFDLALM